MLTYMCGRCGGTGKPSNPERSLTPNKCYSCGGSGRKPVTAKWAVFNDRDELLAQCDTEKKAKAVKAAYMRGVTGTERVRMDRRISVVPNS